MNHLLFLIGLIVGLPNALRRRIFGYGHPRPIHKKAIKENISYDIAVVENFEKHLKRYLSQTSPLLGKAVLEIGPGPDLGTGIVFLAKGAKNYTAIDRFSLLRENQYFYEVLLNELEQNHLIFSETRQKELKHIISETGKKTDLENPMFVYKKLEGQRKEHFRLNQKFNFVFSQAVLEHIDNVAEIFKSMYENLEAGGTICHEIDFQTHASIIRNRDPLNILRYPEWLYRSCLYFPGAPNRLRLSEYEAIARKTGFFNVEIIPLHTMSPSQVQNVKASLPFPFRNVSNEELQILSAVLIARK